MKYPLISVVIATYNSEKSLGKVLKAVKSQDYPKNKLEIFIIDGGSTDSTLKIAEKYRCKVFNNPKVDQVYAKHIGYMKARGEYLLLLDSDEVLENKKSIRLKAESMQRDSRIKAVISTGLKKPHSYPDINCYLNEFGDPFSFFMYRNSKDPKFFISELKSGYVIVSEDKSRVTFDFSVSPDPPFIELTAMGVMVNLKYIRSVIPSVFKNAPIHTHLFYLLNTRGNLFSVMKHDSIVHYSVSNLTNYLKKIRSRIRSNIYGTGMGEAGFKGREKYHRRWYKLKKFLFLPYTLSLILPFTDSAILSINRKKLVYFVHVFLCLYTLLLIIFYYTLKLLGIKTKLRGYGE